MRNYVQYHNTEFMGYPCDDGDSDYFSIVTNKSVSNLVGNRIWLISGEGRPRNYFLCKVFIVDEVGQDDSGNYANGVIGTSFKPLIPLNNLSWFKDFMKSQQNFRFGLNEIQDERFI